MVSMCDVQLTLCAHWNNIYLVHLKRLICKRFAKLFLKTETPKIEKIQ